MEVRDVGRLIAKDVICSISIHWSEQKTEQASCDKNFVMFPDDRNESPQASKSVRGVIGHQLNLTKMQL